MSILLVLRNWWRYLSLNHWSFESTYFYSSSADGITANRCPQLLITRIMKYLVIHIGLNFKFRNNDGVVFGMKTKFSCSQNQRSTVGIVLRQTLI